jgi:hypothetical protein
MSMQAAFVAWPVCLSESYAKHVLSNCKSHTNFRPELKLAGAQRAIMRDLQLVLTLARAPTPKHPRDKQSSVNE